MTLGIVVDCRLLHIHRNFPSIIVWACRVGHVAAQSLDESRLLAAVVLGESNIATVATNAFLGIEGLLHMDPMGNP
jgi:hypothetical protein